ncbi:MAG: hypothetical protein RR932_06120 [Acinetobacter sp.]
MTAISWFPPDTSILRQDIESPAKVTAFMDDFFAKMALLNLTQTTDTGQYLTGSDADTALPSGGGILGYRIYRLDDVLTATHPIYIKIAIKAGYAYSKATGFSIHSEIKAGTSTDGNGEITGHTTSFTTGAGYPYDKNQGGLSYQSFAATIPAKGFLGIVFNAGIQERSYNQIYAPVCFFLERIPNTDGTPSDQGFSLFSPSFDFLSNNQMNAGYNYSNVGISRVATVMFNENTYTHTDGVPFFGSAKIIPDVFVHNFYHITPEPVRATSITAILKDKVNKGTQFATRVYGESETNFIAMDAGCAFHPCPAALMVIAFAYE